MSDQVMNERPAEQSQVGKGVIALKVLFEERAAASSILYWRSVTGQRSNQLNYVPTRQINKMRNNQCLCGFAPFA
jgi:hypothetical protein